MTNNDVYTIEGIIPALKHKGTVIAVAQRPHPGDRFLFTVLIQTAIEGSGPNNWPNDSFVVWNFNAQTNGFGVGSYFEHMDSVDNRYAATVEFARRVSNSCNK